MPSPRAETADVVLVGGGLANGLIALRLKALRPDLRVVVIERDATFGGRHTWSHFATDVSPAIGAWLAPLIAHRWDRYEVRFPSHCRTLSTPYLAISSERFHEVVSAAMGDDGWTSAGVVSLDANMVVLTDGRATGGPDPLGRSRIAAGRLAAEGAAAVVVDCETSYIRLGLATELAGQLGAPVVRLEQLRADYLAQAVRRAA